MKSLLFICVLSAAISSCGKLTAPVERLNTVNNRPAPSRLAASEQKISDEGMFFNQDGSDIDGCLSFSRTTCQSHLSVLSEYEKNIREVHGSFTELSDLLQKRMMAVDSCMNRLTRRIEFPDNGPNGCGK